MIIEILNGGEIQAQESTEYLVFADTIFVLPASQVKNTIKIKVSGVVNIGLKFTYPNDSQRTIGVINGTTYKPDLNDNLVYNFTLNDQTEMELKSYKRSINTYWTPYVTEMPSSQGIVEEPQPIMPLGLVNPDNINSTDDIPEGVTNLYFTEQRAIDSFTADAPITLVDGAIGTTLTQYTDEDARNAVGLALQNGTHTGISFVNADAQDKINATVSLSPFSIGNLGDVLLGGLALQNNHFLKYSNGKWINSTLSSTNLSDINSLMKKSDNLAGLTNLATARTNLGLGSASTSSSNDFLPVGSTLSSLSNVTLVNLQNKNVLGYDSATGKWTNRFLASTDIQDINKIYAPINNPTFTGTAKSSEPLLNSNDNTIATTGWVRQVFVQSSGGATQLNDLSDVQISALQIGQVLRYDGDKFVNAKITFTDITGTDILLKKADNLAGLSNVATARSNLGLGSASLLSASEVLTKNSPLSDLSDVSFVNLENNQVIKYDLATDSWTNKTIKANDIEGLNGIYAPINSPTFTGIPLAPTPAINSNSNQIPTTAWVRARIAEGGGGGGGGATQLNDLTDVSINDLTQVAGQTLRFNGVEYVNAKLASTDLSNSASVVLLNTSPTFVTQAQGDNSNKVATTAYVDTLTENFVSFNTLDLIAGNIEGAIPTLDINGHIKSNQLPNLAITHVDSGLLANRPLPSNDNVGDVYITTDTFQTFISTGTEWLEILNPSASEIVDLQTELDETQFNLGLNTDGSRPVYSSNHYINNIDSHHVALGKLDTQLKSTNDSVLLKANNLSDLNDVATARDNLGLGSSATLNAGTHAGEVLLISVNDTLPVLSGVNLTGVLKTSQAGLPNGIATLDNNGKLTPDQLPDIAITFVEVVANEEDKPAPAPENMGHVYIVTSTSKTYISDGSQWVELLSASEIAIASAQAEIDRMETAIGLATNGDFIPFNDTSYLDTAETITESLTLLDTQIKSNTDTLNTFGSSVLYDAGINPNQVLLLDVNGAIDSSILNLATTIGNINIGDIVTINDNINSLIDIPTLKTDLDLSITDLNDVDITGIDVNQTLVWDGLKFIPSDANNLLVDDQGRYIETFDCGLVTDLVIGSSMDFQDASGTGETPLNAEDLFLNTVYFSQEDYGAIIG